jgi:hypothetical protein
MERDDGASMVCLHLSLILGLAGASPASSAQLTAWIDTAVTDPNAILVPIPQTQTLYKAGRARIPFHAGDDTSLSEAIKRHEMDELVELGPEALFELIVREAAAGTRFADKININRPHWPGQLNVYTFRAARQIDHIASCAYMGSDAIIVCHADRLLELTTRFVTKDEYLDTAVIKREADGSLRRLKRSELDQQNRDTIDLTLSGGFLGWILAHEIGHAVLHADKLRNGGYMHFSGGIAGTLERQADDFAAQQILHSDILIQMSISSLNEFVAFEYLRFFSNSANLGRYELTDGAEDPSSTTLRLHLSEKYPEEFLLYRAASINAAVTQLDPDRDTTGVPQAQFANLSIEGRSSNAVYVVLAAASLAVIAVVLFLRLYRGRHA